MKSIEQFTIPDAPECTVELPLGLVLFDARQTDDGITLYYMDAKVTDEVRTVTWYVLGLGTEVADNFPGTYFKHITMRNGFDRFLFYKQNPKKREPIVAKVPGELDASPGAS